MSGGDAASQVGQLTKLLLVFGVELGAWVLHYAAYTQTMTVMPGGYLVDVPGIGWLFQAAPDAQVNHLVAAFMALASVATPVFGFFFLIRNRVIAEPELFFVSVPNRIFVGLLLAFWALMVTVEVTNVLTLIEQYVNNPFVKSGPTDVIREHKGLALLSAVVIAIVNSAVALGTAMVWTAIFPKRGV